MGIELLIGIIGYFSLHILSLIGKYTLTWPLSAISIVVFLLLLLPTMMMGASLPILVAYLNKRLQNIVQSVGLLYAANTFGAATACILVACLFLRYLGLANTVNIAASINSIVGFTAIMLTIINRKAENIVSDPEQITLQHDLPAFTATKLQAFFILALSTITGYISLSYEILWLHTYTFITGGRGIDFAWFLGYFLGGIALGAYICANFFAPVKNEQFAGNKKFSQLFWVLLIAAITSYLVIPAATNLIQYSNNLQSITCIFCLPALLFGIIFPLLSKYYVPIINSTGSAMGKFYFANIVGSTASVLLTGFVLMNYFSLATLAKYLFLLAIIAACVPLFFFSIN